MNRPLVSVVLVYAAGLLLGSFLQPPPVALLGVTALVALATLASARLRPLGFWPLVVLAGWTNFLCHTAVVSPHDLRTLTGNDSALVAVRGELAETPRLKISVHDEQETWRHVARVRVSEIRFAENFVPATGELLVTTPGQPSPEYFTGQAVEISGVIARPPLPLADGLFDFQNYLATRGIYYQLKTVSTNDWQLRSPILSHPPLTDRFLDWSKNSLALGLPEEDEPLRLLWAMTLGWRTAFTGDLSEPFLRAGTMHMFAIDGLRIALLSGMIVALLRALRLSRAWCGVLAVPTLWFYTGATGWEPSAVRASVMMTLVLAGWALQRPTELINSLAAAALVILVWDPRQLFEASFQLSFFVMLIIGLMLPKLNQITDRLLLHDALLPKELIPRRRLVTFSFLRILARYGALSFTAWAGSIPLAAKYFHLLSPISTPANMLAVPLGTFALMANLGALVCGHWLPWLTALFNHAAWFFMVAMTWVSVETAKIPGAYFYVPEPSLAAIVIYYAALIAIFSGWFSTGKRRLGGGIVLLVIGGTYFWQWQSSRAETDITVLPLNGGHAVWVDADGRANDWLINCGNERAVDFTLKNYLRAQGVNALPRLILTEGDTKNIGGASKLDELFDIGELCTSGVKFRSLRYRDTIAAFEAPPSRHKVLNCGDPIGSWRVLFPDTTTPAAAADDQPVVLLGSFHGTKVLLLSDLSRAGQSRLLAGTNDLHADIVVAGLPTEGEPLCDALIHAIRPGAMVIADSNFPATRRANGALRKRLEQKHIPVMYTRSAGAVKIVATPCGWKMTTMDGQSISSAPSSG